MGVRDTGKEKPADSTNEPETAERLVRREFPENVGLGGGSRLVVRRRLPFFAQDTPQEQGQAAVLCHRPFRIVFKQKDSVLFLGLHC